MATTNKDFRVKNGLYVTQDANIAGTATVGVSTDSLHAITKGYVDSVVLATVSATAPSSPSSGKLWLDTSVTTQTRLKVYSGTSWVTVATTEDANYVPDHIHDDAIEGTGQVDSVIG